MQTDTYWKRMSGRPIGRRALLRASARAGVGATGLALVGCGDDDDDDEAVADSPADDQAQADQTDQADQAETPTDQTDDEPGAPAAGGLLPGELTAAEEASISSIEEEFRLRYHWSKLQNLPGHEAGPQYGGTFQMPRAPSTSYDLLTTTGATAGTSYSFNGLVYYPVSDFGGAHETLITADLASGWEIPDDLTITFTIKDGIHFHNKPPVNGREMTMEDVRISYEMHQEAPAQGPTYEGVTSIESSDSDRTLTFRFAEPDAAFLGNLLGIPDMVFPPEMAGTDQFANDPIGTGPYVTVEIDTGQFIRFERNPEFHHLTDPWTGMQLPYFDAIEGRAGGAEAYRSAFQAGDMHMISAFDRIDWEDITGARPEVVTQVTSPPASGMVHVGMRLEKEPWNDVRVRRAMSLGVDRGAMQDGVFLGVAAAGYGQLWHWFEDPNNPGQTREWPWDFTENGEWHQRDPDFQRARELLDAAGYNDDNPLEFKYDTMSYTIGRSLDAHRFMVEQWERNLPVRISVTEDELLTWFGREASRDYDDMGGSWNTGLGQQEPDAYTRRVLSTESGGAKYGVNDPEIDELAAAQRRELDPDRRNEILLQIKDRDLDQVYRIFTVNAYHWHTRDPRLMNILDNLNGWAPQGYRNSSNYFGFFSEPI